MAHAFQTNGVAEALKQAQSRLDAGKIRDLEQRGYAVFPALLSAEQLDAIRRRFEKLMAQQGYHVGRQLEDDDRTIADIILMQFQSGHLEAGDSVNEVQNLVNEGSMFDALYTAPELVGGVFHAMNGDFKLSELTARETLPGGGEEKAYRTAIDTAQPGVQGLWLLDEFDAASGGLAVAEGSHRAGADGAAFVPVYAPAGSLILVDARVLRKEPVNESDRNIRTIRAAFVARHQPQALPQREFIRMTTYSRISELAKYVLDV